MPRTQAKSTTVLSGRSASQPRCVRAGFTLVDVMVSLAVVVLLIGILLPAIDKVKESARRVVCQSNVRQIGLGVVMYADDYRGQMPSSVYTSPTIARSMHRPQNLVTLRLPQEDRIPGMMPWDGMGVLYSQDYVGAPKVFYCPSHRGENPFRAFAPVWGDEQSELVSNYHFRGLAPAGMDPNADRFEQPVTRNLYRIDPSQSSLIADGMRIKSDYSHKIGSNFFRADLTVHWYDDPRSEVLQLLPETKDLTDAAIMYTAWEWFDVQANVDSGVLSPP